MIRLIIILLLITVNLFAQDSTVSKAFKINAPKTNRPLVKPKQASYPLLAGYLLLEEANAGDPYAEHELGIRYLLGKGFPRDTVRAVEWIRKAVASNLVTAKFNYGLMLNNGTGVEWNPYEAYRNFKFAAEKGMPQAQFMYGLFLLDNLVVNRDYSKAYKEFKEAYAGGFKPAKDIIKEMDKLNLITPEEREAETNAGTSSQYMLDQSLLMDNNWQLDLYEFESDSTTKKETENLLSDVLSENKNKLKQRLGISKIADSTKLTDTSAIGLIRYAAEAGSPEALLLYGASIEKEKQGKKTKLNSALNYIRAFRLGSYKAAQKLYKIAEDTTFFLLLKSEIDANNPDAMFVWAALTALGFDYRISSDQALDLLRRAAEMNHIDSIIELGLIYYSGSIVDKNEKKGVEYWKKAADLGSSEAKVRIASSEIIKGNLNNCKTNISVLKQAVEEGSVLAQTALGFAYEHGTCVKKHKATAAEYYRRASNRGNETAFESLKNMYDEIRPDDDEFQILEN